MSDDVTDEFLAAASRLGANPALVQGAGGNVSFKRDGIIWVKASGKWLVHAESEPMLVGLDLQRVRRQLVDAADDKDAIIGAEIDPTKRLRPSIETTLHVAMPHAIVLHVHCTTTISWAVRSDAREKLPALLQGLNWTWIPYARPGLPLTRMIESQVRNGEDVLVLANHGLVVGGETVHAAEALMEDVRHRLGGEVRSACAPASEVLGEILAAGGYKLPRHDAVHDLATDKQNLAHVLAGTLYPDHIVFLGHGVAVLRDDETPRDAARRVAAQNWPEPALVLVPDAGAVLREDVSLNGEEMALCLSLVAARIPAGAPLTALSRQQELDLVDWDAEKYRRNINA